MDPRVMVFVDGSNLMIELASELRITHPADKPSNAMLQVATQSVRAALNTYQAQDVLQSHRQARRYWFGSVLGDDSDLSRVRATLKEQGFDPHIFKKYKGRAEKGVDLAVAREMLIHAFYSNYDTAVLVAGDSDYVGLVHDIKRLGKTVVTCFYRTNALSAELCLSSDSHLDIPPPIAVNEILCHELGHAS